MGEKIGNYFPIFRRSYWLSLGSGTGFFRSVPWVITLSGLFEVCTLMPWVQAVPEDVEILGEPPGCGWDQLLQQRGFEWLGPAACLSAQVPCSAHLSFCLWSCYEHAWDFTTMRSCSFRHFGMAEQLGFYFMPESIWDSQRAGCAAQPAGLAGIVLWHLIFPISQNRIKCLNILDL